MKKQILTFIMTALAVAGFTQSAHQLLRQGNDSYGKQEFEKAEENYRKSLEVGPSVKSNYNLGNAVYQQERYKEAIKHYEATAASVTDKKLKAKAYYNLGNAYMKSATAPGNQVEDALQKGINAYKEALRNQPNDMDAKHNLSLAIKQLRKQQQQKQQQQNKDQQQKKEQKKEDQQDGKQQQQQQDQQQQQEQQQKEGKELSKKEAQKLLQIMNEEEKKVQEKMRRSKGNRKSSEKDW